jgi:hypothetical protein
MSKRINAAKLKAMGYKRVIAVCERHANRAIDHKESGRRHKMNLHCGLLDQCAAVARELKHERSSRRG